MPKPHIAIVVHDFNPTYGQGRYCYELIHALQDRAKFTVLSNTSDAPGIESVTWQQIETCRYNALTTVFSFLPVSEWAVRRLAPDLIHAQGMTCWSADVITGHICNGERARHLNTRWFKPRIFATLIAPFEKAFYRQRRASHLIAISNHLADDVRRCYEWKKPVSIIYHGTDTHTFRPCADPAERQALRQKFRLPEGKWTWLYMGEAIKGLRQAIEQLSHFPHAHLLVISRSDFSEYRLQAQTSQVLDRITFHGFHPLPQEAFQASDLFLYASDYEPFGMVVTEAMATGLPVVVGNKLGAAELIKHQENGLVFDPHNAQEMTAQLNWLNQNPHKASELGQLARETIRAHSWERCAEETWRVYEKVLSAKSTL
jgi:glycosyltransferase involved in cell wall biosynthesis